MTEGRYLWSVARSPKMTICIARSFYVAQFSIWGTIFSSPTPHNWRIIEFKFPITLAFGIFSWEDYLLEMEQFV